MSFIGKLGRIALDIETHLSLPALAVPSRAPVDPPPASQDWYSKVQSWPVLANDTIGDCTIVGVLSAILQWRTILGTLGSWMPTDADAIRLYSQLTGFIPGRPATDQGAREPDILTAWTKGLDVGGGQIDKLGAFATVGLTGKTPLQSCIAWFGNAYLGWNLPLVVESIPYGQPLDVPSCGLTGIGAPGSLGGHCSLGVGYDDNWIYTPLWGQLRRVSWPFFWAYADAAYALLSPDFMKLSSSTPVEIPWGQLLDNWKRVNQSAS
jgi:hypothetical protein